jgi:hypothetical protein
VEFAKRSGKHITITDQTTKLFYAPISCVEGHPISPIGATEGFPEPYFKTAIGLAFCGTITEGLSVIALIQQQVSTLWAPSDDRPRPGREPVMDALEGLVRSYFASHNKHQDPYLDLLAFGFDDEGPWSGKIEARKTGKVTAYPPTGPATQLLGDWSSFSRQSTARDDFMRRRLANRGWRRKRDGREPVELEVMRLKLGLAKLTEQRVLQVLRLDAAGSVGGVLQRLEIGLNGQQVVHCFTHDAHKYSTAGEVSVSSQGLLIPWIVGQAMGTSDPRNSKHPRS